MTGKGHSRGGAAAILTGARLISMGVSPAQIEVITFGAPAVGNEVFAMQSGSVLNLTRVVISGDVVTGILQTLVGGYKQFGREILWEASNTVDHPHRLTEYVDLVIKNYYDKRQQAMQAGILSAPHSTDRLNGNGIYIAPLKNSLPQSLAKEYCYMKQAVQDEYRQVLPEYLFGDESGISNWRKMAAKAGAKWLVVPEVEAYREKEAKNLYYIAFSQTVYEVSSGRVINFASFSTGTFNLTPLEAFIHSSRSISVKLPELCDSAGYKEVK